MRALSMVKYHWRRQRWTALLFAAVMLVISTATLFVVRAEYSSNMLVFENGVARVVQGVASMNMSFNYSLLFVVLLWATAVTILRQERAFFVTASSSRWEFMLGLVLFIVGYALFLTALTYVISVLNRLTLMLMGMQVRQSWSLELILTGNNAHLAREMLLGFTGMLKAAGYASLVYILFARWWKQILVLWAIQVVISIVLGVQISLGAYTQSMVDAAQNIVEWIENVFIPRIGPLIDKLFFEQRTWVLVLRDVGQSAVCFGLVYPIILRMRVK